MSTMKSAQTVYYGPSTSTYPSVGSMSQNENVTAIWKEGTWVHIEYTVTGTTNKKRGYVPATTITITESVPTITNSNLTRYVNTSGTTYTGPASTGYVAAGSVSRGETVIYIGQMFNSYAFIEYAISGTSQKKRAYFCAGYLSTAPVSDLVMKDPINKSNNFTGGDHVDYAVAIGTPVYAMCDGTFRSAYIWGKKYQSSADSYLSLGRGTRLTPDSGWKTADGRTPSYIEYGHLSSLSSYSTPNYVERCQGSESGTNYYESTVVLANKAVKCGDLIGYSGNSGNTYGTTGEHLHIQLR